MAIFRDSSYYTRQERKCAIYLGQRPPARDLKPGLHAPRTESAHAEFGGTRTSAT